METICWKVRARNGEVLGRVGKKNRLFGYHHGQEEKPVGTNTRYVMVEKLERLVNAMRNERRRRDQTTDDMRMRYQEVKRLTQDRKS